MRDNFEVGFINIMLLSLLSCRLKLCGIKTGFTSNFFLISEPLDSDNIGVIFDIIHGEKKRRLV